jgi:hypothetical protein
MPFFPEFRELLGELNLELQPRELAKLSNREFESYCRELGISRGDIELILVARANYNYLELMEMTTTVEVVEALQGFSTSQLEAIIEAELRASELGISKIEGLYYLDVITEMLEGDVVWKGGPAPQLETRIPTVELPREVKSIIKANRGSPQNVISYQFDKEGKLVWLESGKAEYNSSKLSKNQMEGSGFWHSWMEHKHDFVRNNIKTELELVDKINEAIKNGEKSNSRNKRGGYEYITNINHKYDLLVAVAENGYVVSSYIKPKNK